MSGFNERQQAIADEIKSWGYPMRPCKRCAGLNLSCYLLDQANGTQFQQQDLLLDESRRWAANCEVTPMYDKLDELKSAT